MHTNHVQKLTVNGKQEHLFLAQWASIGNGLVFVSDANVYYKPNATAAEIQLTTDGDEVIRYGICDWVYEGNNFMEFCLKMILTLLQLCCAEEVFASKEALWFSPDGTKLAIMKFNDTSIEPMLIPVYGPPGSLQFQYPKQISLHYPKVCDRK